GIRDFHVTGVQTCALPISFGLRATLAFDLAPGEYHANVVLAVLAGRAALFAPDGFADPAVPAAIAALYAPHAVAVTAAERDAFRSEERRVGKECRSPALPE